MTLTDTRELVHELMREAQATLIAGFEDVEREGAPYAGLPPAGSMARPGSVLAGVAARPACSPRARSSSAPG
jgi:hypothetical protein